MRNLTYGCWDQFAFKRLVIVVGMLGITACATTPIPVPTAPQARWAAQRWPGTTPADLEQGRSLYIAKCSGCHTLRLPSVYAQERWPLILDKMQPRAKITDLEKQRILAYVLAVKQLEDKP